MSILLSLPCQGLTADNLKICLQLKHFLTLHALYQPKHTHYSTQGLAQSAVMQMSITADLVPFY